FDAEELPANSDSAFANVGTSLPLTGSSAFPLLNFPPQTKVFYRWDNYAYIAEISFGKGMIRYLAARYSSPTISQNWRNAFLLATTSNGTAYDGAEKNKTSSTLSPTDFPTASPISLPTQTPTNNKQERRTTMRVMASLDFEVRSVGSLLSSLVKGGFNATIIPDIKNDSFANKLKDAQVLIMPSLVASFTAATLDEQIINTFRSFVAEGGLLVVASSSLASTFINDVFGL
ncbi:MAG: hypothetical protein AAGM67_21750, partial [Bacteroidota bacterium]